MGEVTSDLSDMQFAPGPEVAKGQFEKSMLLLSWNSLQIG
jgi:hypothetical protein